MFKSIVAIAIGTLLFSAFNLCHAQEQEPILIKFVHVADEQTPKGQGALLFKQLVDQRLAGKVNVEVYPTSSLFGDDNELQALANNEVQLLAPSLAKFEKYTKQLQVFDLPFLFDDLDAVTRFQKRAKGRQLLRSMEAHNIIGLAYWHNGMKQLSATKALQVPSDAAGLKFRIQPSSVLEAQFYQIGAAPLAMPFAEVFAALQNGKVQGTENAWSNIYTKQLHTLQPFITETNHGALDYMLVSNQRFWFSIPHQIRSELEAIIDEGSFAVNRQSEEANRADRQRIEASGSSQIITLTDEQRAAWRAAMQPVWQQFEAEIGADILKAAQTVNRKSRD
ncbi:DctP family TRAP transporter solute-binding subunit [Pseudomonas anguilliseptica]|uniref:C4-dicarboxylate-binding protein DctP n=1 Tax=Pseudomonas anguilliseptica TaxID=53406 RepID=A0A1H5G459_PSEAG|nr:DctP family TRAP transporter solute-binding subunit [Pseudomonas anguilliseptica]SEE10224.1 C4-dicarboxylate-binding protein DctP [Pseudomonas anguilliseptica]